MVGVFYLLLIVAKQKNTKNKAKHSELMGKKKNKLRSTKELTKQRLKDVLKKSQENSKD